MLKNDVTLKPGLEVIQGHLKWRRSIDCIRVPIVVFFSNIMILLEVNEFKKGLKLSLLSLLKIFFFTSSFISV